MAEHFDVAIIGAGVHGASAAHHLAQSGASVAIFDGRGPAGGPTAGSSGLCRAYYTNPFLAELSRDSLRIFADFGDQVGGDCGYRRTGAAYLHAAEDRESVLATSAMQNALGIASEVIDGHDMVELLPGFDLAGMDLAVWQDEAGYADPYSTTTSLCTAGAGNGAILLKSKIEQINPKKDGVDLVCADGTRFSAGELLVAAGPWTGPLLNQVGVNLPLTVERHIVTTFNWGSNSRVPFIFIDVAGGFYFRPDGENGYLLGGVHPAGATDPDLVDPRIHDLEFAHLADAMSKRVQAAGHAAKAGVGGWAAAYDVSPD